MSSSAGHDPRRKRVSFLRERSDAGVKYPRQNLLTVPDALLWRSGTEAVWLSGGKKCGDGRMQ